MGLDLLTQHGVVISFLEHYGESGTVCGNNEQLIVSFIAVDLNEDTPPPTPSHSTLAGAESNWGRAISLELTQTC